MKMKKQLLPMFVLIAMLSAIMLVSSSHVTQAQSTAQIMISPAQVYNFANFTTVPHLITFNISIVNASRLSAWQVGIQFTPTVLLFDSITIPTDNVFAPNNIVEAGDTSSPGLVIYGVNLLELTKNFTGSGVLMQLTLSVVETPPAMTNLLFEGISIDTFLLDDTGADISFTYVGSSFADIYLIGTKTDHTVSGSSNPVVTITNGTIGQSDLAINTGDKRIELNVTGTTGDQAYLFAILPKTVIGINSSDLTHWKFFVNNQETSAAYVTENSTHTTVFIPNFIFSSGVEVYLQGEYIIPEFASVIIVLLIASSVTVAIVKGRKKIL
jgi:hypothetical protein